MRRFVGALLTSVVALTLLQTAVPAGAGTEKESKQYVVATGSPAGAFGILSNGVGGVEFTPPEGATFVTLQIEDVLGSALGVDTFGTVCQDVTGDGTCDGSRGFCGKTNTPVAVRAGFDVNVFVHFLDTCAGDTPALGLTGTVTATFTIPTKIVLKEVGKKKLTWSAGAFCAPLCPYNEPAVTALGTRGCDKEPLTTPGSWSDLRVKVPAKVAGKVPLHMVVVATPTVDWDLFACAVEKRRYREAGTSGEGACTPATNCAERMQFPVKPGQTYVLRAYNWSDPNTSLEGAVSWLVKK